MTNPFNEESVEDFIEDYVESDDRSPRRMSLTYSTQKDSKQYITKIYYCGVQDESYKTKYEVAKHLMENFKDVHRWFTDKKVEEHNLMYLVDFAHNPVIDTYYVTYEKKEGSLLDLIKKGTKFDENEIRRIVNDLLKALAYLHGDKKEEHLIHTFIAPEHILYETTGNEERKYFLGGLEYCLTPEAFLDDNFEKLKDNLKYHQKYHPCNFKDNSNDKTYPIVLGMICHTLYTQTIPTEYKKYKESDLKEIEDEKYKSASGEFKSFMQHCYKQESSGNCNVWGLPNVYKAAFVKGYKEAIFDYLWVPLRFHDPNGKTIHQADERTTVKMCKDRWTGKTCVMKIIRKTKNVRVDIKNEQRILTKLKEDNNGFVPDYISSFMIDKELHLILEYIDGSSLTNFIKEDLEAVGRKSLYFAEITLVSWNIAKALKALLDSGTIHRDVKLDNIFISTFKSKWPIPYIRDAKLADFDVSKIVDPNKPNTTKVMNLGYTAPEILSNQEYDEKVDVWSFGALLFNMLTMEEKRKMLEKPTEEKINQAIESLRNNFSVQDFEEYKGNERIMKLCEKIKEKYIELVRDCLKYDSETRLTINDVLERVHNIIEELDIEQHKYKFNEKSVRKVQMEIKKDEDRRVERGIVFFRYAGVSEHIAEIYDVENKDKFIVHRELLVVNGSGPADEVENEKEKEVTLDDLEKFRDLDEGLCILLDVGKAIKYTHGRNMVIRGLNAQCIYILRYETKTKAKVLMRFDLLREVTTKSNRYTNLKGDDFIAPELKNKKDTYCGAFAKDKKDEKDEKDKKNEKEKAENFKKADIWSFGMVIKHVLALEERNKSSISFSYTIGINPKVHPKLEEIKKHCLEERPENRINSTKLVELMEELYYEYTL